MPFSHWFWSKTSFLLNGNKKCKMPPSLPPCTVLDYLFGQTFSATFSQELLRCFCSVSFFSTKSSWWEFKFLKTWNVAVFLLRSKRAGSMCTQMPIYFLPKWQNFYSIKSRKEILILPFLNRWIQLIFAIL